MNEERETKAEGGRERGGERDASFVCVSVWYLKGAFVASLSVCTNELRLLRIEATWEVTIGCACYSDIPYFVPFSFTINAFASFPIFISFFYVLFLTSPCVSGSMLPYLINIFLVLCNYENNNIFNQCLFL